MTTAELLETILDGSKFQALAEDVLRRKELDCEHLIGTGANARGETIPAPLDGFCLVPGTSPPRYVMVEITKTATDDLPTKWLASGGAKRPGDFTKAGSEAQKIRQRDPSATFVVYLVTNQRLKQALLDKVYASATRLNVAVNIWEQSRLAAYLDDDPEGQWLKQKHFQMGAALPRRKKWRSFDPAKLGYNVGGGRGFPRVA